MISFSSKSEMLRTRRFPHHLGFNCTLVQYVAAGMEAVTCTVAIGTARGATVRQLKANVGAAAVLTGSVEKAVHIHWWHVAWWERRIEKAD